MGWMVGEGVMWTAPVHLMPGPSVLLAEVN